MFNNMIISLRIQNLALVDDLFVDFKSGFTVLTGETGAGKSLLIDALALLIGSRGDGGMVRQGSERAIVESIVDGNFETWNTFLEERGLPNEQPIVLRREITSSGRSRAWLNGSACNLADLREAGRIWIRLTSQHDYQSLMTEDRHLFLLDEILGIRPNLTAEVETIKEIQTNLAAKKMSESKVTERLDWLTEKIADLTKLNPKKHEWSTLHLEREPLRHAAQLVQSFRDSVEALGQASCNVEICHRILMRTVDMLPTIKNDLDRLSSVMFELEDILSLTKSQVSHWSNKGVDYIEAIESRMANFEKLARCHHCEPDELAQRLSELTIERNGLLASNSNIEQLTSALQKACEHYCINAEALHKHRMTLAKKLEYAVDQQLKDLGITGARLQIRLTTTKDMSSPAIQNENPVKISIYGFSSATIWIESNIGEGFKPLAKTASGGELSRLMLALQSAAMTLHSNIHDPLVLVLDEVDAGIGGEAAIAVSKAIGKLSCYHQVLVVTHLAQVASSADHHGFLHKKVQNGRTRSNLTWLSRDNRLGELARLLSGHPNNPQAIAHAHSLLHDTI
jgi:DNA repair protein RecN (Recombination protein N)